MQTLHLRASDQVMQKLLASINKLAKDGESIEILDDVVYQKEKRLILAALQQIENGEVYSHEEVWRELLHE